MKSKWLSVYVYVNGQFEQLLSKSHRNLLNPLISNKVISSFFFIRYYDTGPHIRLRLQCQSNNLLEQAKLNVINFLDDITSDQTDQHNSANSLLSYRFVDYEPEIERYGGINGIEIAESHFHMSSITILKQFEIFENEWDYNQGIGFAIQLHIAFILSLSLLPQVRDKLLNYLYDGWVSSALNLPTLLNKKNAPYNKEALEEAYEKSYLKQREQLIVAAEQLLLNMNKDTVSWLNDWKRHTIETHQSIIELAQLNSDKILSREESEGYAIEIYQSYIHMTNNRIGLRNMDEAFVAFVIRKILKEINPTVRPEHRLTLAL
jgi:thiopeptide-type bacteriocin biosynthesis protein